MQKWSPEPFETPAEAHLSAVVDAEVFQPTTTAVVEPGAQERDACEFRREAGFADSKALMNSLTPKERGQVYELVELDLAEEYQTREQALTAEYAKKLAESEAEAQQMIATWTGQIADALAQELTNAAAAAARLAVQVADKIVRQSVAVDPQILARVIETTLFKITANSPLTIYANPVDAAWLEDQPILAERLNIGQIVADRRIDRGGCVIQSEGREWDATLSRQLDTLDEIVKEMIVTNEVVAPLLPPVETPADPPPASESEVPDVPGVE